MDKNRGIWFNDISKNWEQKRSYNNSIPNLLVFLCTEMNHTNYLMTSAPWEVVALANCVSLKESRLTFSGSTFSASRKWPFGLPAWMVISFLYSQEVSCWNLGSSSSESSSSCSSSSSCLWKYKFISFVLNHGCVSRQDSDIADLSIRFIGIWIYSS